MTFFNSLYYVAGLLVRPGDVVERFDDVGDDGEEAVDHGRPPRREQGAQGQGQQLLAFGLGHARHLVQPDVKEPAGHSVLRHVGPHLRRQFGRKRAERVWLGHEQAGGDREVEGHQHGVIVAVVDSPVKREQGFLT